MEDISLTRPSVVKEGCRYLTNKYGEILVIKYTNNREVDVRFSRTGSVVTTSCNQIKRGCVKDPFSPSVHGVGYLGSGRYSCWEGGHKSKAYTIWSGMLLRCYCSKYQLKQPAYAGCSVSDNWHNFQNFASWFEENYVDGYQLDKDLILIGNRVYSEDTCVFVSAKVNGFLINREAGRGEYAIGVSRRGKSFRSHCRVGSGKGVCLGTFTTEEGAHDAWVIEKLKMASYLKQEMDTMDTRIYPNVLKIIGSYK